MFPAEFIVISTVALNIENSSIVVVVQSVVPDVGVIEVCAEHQMNL